MVGAKEREFLKGLNDLIAETRDQQSIRKLRDLASETKRAIDGKRRLDSVVKVLRGLAERGEVPTRAFKIANRYDDPEAIRIL